MPKIKELTQERMTEICNKFINKQTKDKHCIGCPLKIEKATIKICYKIIKDLEEREI